MLSDLLEVEFANNIIEAHNSVAISYDQHVVFCWVLVLFAGIITPEEAEVGLDSVIEAELILNRWIIHEDLLRILTFRLVALIEFQVSQLGLRLEGENTLDSLVYL